jgi:hypothetical protein
LDRTVSALISELDEAVAADGCEGQGAVDRVVRQARGLFVPPDPDTAFGARYLRALQDHPESFWLTAMSSRLSRAPRRNRIAGVRGCGGIQ